ncbi:hypothetical protein [Ralstonia solanacearum]|uniref:hypothetical protein n=1 Tax=Ralstonia solanacearum TaxID=305 RepID=UPI0018D0F015|nr:hypothetical protein [Ralstonia solanacearum]
MKLGFSWNVSAEGDFAPYCSSDVVGKDGLSFLACLLMDDGGQGHFYMIPWVDEGIARVYAVIKGEAAAVNWDRDAWGAEISLDGAEVYSLYDEKYSEMITVTMFLHALLAWREFIKSTPQIGIVQEVEI